MPLTYVVDGMKQVTIAQGWTHQLDRDLLVMAAFIIGSLVLGAVTLRRSR
jgi:hypothetical protein